MYLYRSETCKRMLRRTVPGGPSLRYDHSSSSSISPILLVLHRLQVHLAAFLCNTSSRFESEFCDKDAK